MFQTNAENLLDTWVAQDLPALSVEVSKNTLLESFLRVLDFADDQGDVFDRLKAEVRGTKQSKGEDCLRWTGFI